MNKLSYEDGQDRISYLSQIMNKNPEKAEEGFGELLKDSHDDNILRHLYVSSLRLQGKTKEALDCIREPFYKNPQNNLLYSTYTSVLDCAAAAKHYDIIVAEQEYYYNQYRKNDDVAILQLESLFDVLENIAKNPPPVPEGCTLNL